MDYNATYNAQQLGMYYQDYNFLMGMSGALAGFTTMVIVLLLLTKVASRGR
jgi:hypothetical protein